MALKKFKTNIGEVSNILDSDFSSNYNPFEEYLDKLEWDGVTDHLQDFSRLLTVSNPDFLDMVLPKFIVGMVASVLDDKTTNEQMLVLTGGQGVGKTSFLNKLVPQQLLEYSHTGHLNIDNNDAAIKVSETFLCNLDEMSSLNYRNIDKFKQLLSQKYITGVRRPYARYSDNMRKYASFCGSSNNKEYLLDTTGNRRFLSLEVLSVDLEKLENFNIDGVYAQALSFYINGDVKHWFNRDETRIIEDNNANFIYRSSEEEAILEVFKITDEKNDRRTATDIRQSLLDLGVINRNVDAQKIGRALTKLGFISSKSNGRMLYNVAFVNDMKINQSVKLSFLQKRHPLPTLPSVFKRLENNNNTKKLDL
jgi:predicted P-loop ATPase